MESLQIKLHWKQEQRIASLLEYEEPRVIRRASILSCLHNGMTSGMISKVLHVDPKTVRNIAHVFLEKGLDAALFDDERSGRPIDIDDKERSRIGTTIYLPVKKVGARFGRVFDVREQAVWISGQVLKSNNPILHLHINT